MHMYIHKYIYICTYFFTACKQIKSAYIIILLARCLLLLSLSLSLALPPPPPVGKIITE